MAEWNETLEPYIKVQERIKSATQNPTAGDELIIGVAIVSDAGSGDPTLVRGQKEFVEKFASQEEITSEYLSSLDKLYGDGTLNIASTMWANAYRLAGSNTLLVTRASKSDSSYFTKPLSPDQTVGGKTFILKDGELLVRVTGSAGTGGIKFVIDVNGDSAEHAGTGWCINISDVGVFGNRIEDAGPVYDYLAADLPSLVEQLNETSKFFSPDYKFYTDLDGKTTQEWNGVNPLEVKTVLFNELYIAANILDKSDSRMENGMYNMVVADSDWQLTTPITENMVIDLNALASVDFPEYYVINAYNSATDLKVRIRRFNHDAVSSVDVPASTDLTSVTASQSRLISDSYLGSVSEDRDFYEIAILDKSLSSTVLYFNIGSITGRGDITIDELQENMKMLSFVLPDDMGDLGLNYYGDTREGKTDKQEILVNAKVNTASSKILNVTVDDLKKALDLITEDEVYVTEGLSDLGCTDLTFQNYIANIAINENYFIPNSTVNSTNYMTIGSFAKKINRDSEKQYMSAPWDIDTATLGFKFYASPSVLYWETVSKNRRNNNEFASVLGETTGVVSYQRPVTEFNKKTRQLLLTRKVNTVLWDNAISNWCMNDCYTTQSMNTVENEDGNARLVIHISKNIPVILKQFIGKKINEKLCSDVEGAIRYWFKMYILPLGTTVEAFNVVCNFDAALARQNKIKVVVQVRLPRALKFIDVYNDIYDTGMEFEVVE